jgi:hypothetical protein
MLSELWLKKAVGRNLLVEIDVDGRVILKWILEIRV